MSGPRPITWIGALVLASSLTGCLGEVVGINDDPDPLPDTGARDGGRPPAHDTGTRPDPNDAVAPPPPADTGVTDTGAPPPPPPADGGTPCYRETYDGKVSLADLKSSYSSTKWKATAFDALGRRYADGAGILEAMKTDPDLSRFADPSSFSALMESVDTMCNEETHGWDFDDALKTPGKHSFWFRKDLKISAPTGLSFFKRSELLTFVKDDATAMYDSTYLTGEQGTYDFIFLADELTAYTNGLACVTALASEIKSTISFRDGAASHLLYLEWYLQRARTGYPSLYSAMKASPDWMKFVRFAWARGRFWLGESAGFPNFGIKDKEILAKVDDPKNLGEIEKFTGQSAAEVACHP